MTSLQFLPVTSLHGDCHPVGQTEVGTDATSRRNDERIQGAALDQIAIGLVICDRHGALNYVNEAARYELDSELVLRVSDGQLRCVGRSQSPLEVALSHAATKGTRQLLSLSHADSSLMVAVSPLVPDDLQPSVLVVLGRREICSELSMEKLCGAFGLTFTESRVLKGLVAGLGPRDIAATSAVTLSTVRTHISSIRSKLGVRRVNEMLIRAAQVPPFASALRHPAHSRPS